MPAIQKNLAPDQPHLQLVSPSADLQNAFLAMAEEFSASGDTRYQAALADFSAYLQLLGAIEIGDKLPADSSPQSTYWLLDRSALVGCSRLRHRLTDDIVEEWGQIGYDVRPSRRRQGYGSVILALTLERARQAGHARIVITCAADNLGSVRVIESNGGAQPEPFVSAVSKTQMLRYWLVL